jgi:protein TonB
MADIVLPALTAPDLRHARRPTPRRWLEIALIVSALVHGLLLAIVIFARRPPPPVVVAQEPPGFEMVFKGGEKSPQAVPAPGRFIEIPNGEALPAPPVPPSPEAKMSPPQAEPAPEVNLLPPELQMLAPPEAQPDQQAAQQPAKPERQSRPRRRTAPNPSPFAHPQQYSLAMQASPSVPMGLHGSKSLELSLGRTVRGGMLSDGAMHVSTPGVDGSYLELIHEYVETHKYYPEQAIANGEDGISVLSATITPDGRIRNLRLVESSGSPWLDMAWMGIFRTMQLPRFPPDVKVPQIDFTYSMEYELIRH